MFIGPCIIVIVEGCITNQLTKHTTRMRTQQSQSRKDHNGQYQQKYAYQLHQSDKARHTKHTLLNTINLH